jgi:hypothetical protein
LLETIEKRRIGRLCGQHRISSNIVQVSALAGGAEIASGRKKGKAKAEGEDDEMWSVYDLVGFLSARWTQSRRPRQR